MYGTVSANRRWCAEVVNWLLAALLLTSTQLSNAADPGRAKALVIYQEIKDRYRTTFSHVIDTQAPYNQIIEGIRERIDEEVIIKVLPEGYKAQQLTALVNHQQPVKAVVALGPGVFPLAQGLRDSIQNIPIYVGTAAVIQQGGVAGFDRHIHPQPFFRTLKELVPSIDNVVFIYNPLSSIRVLDLYEKTANQAGYQLTSVPVSSIREAVTRLSQILTSIDSLTTAVWFGEDVFVMNKEVLFPLVLEQAWQRRIAAFSSDPSDVKQGLLFALYPDFKELGRDLGALINSQGKQEEVMLQEKVKVAINSRTARHLRIRMTSVVQQTADIIFPSSNE